MPDRYSALLAVLLDLYDRSVRGVFMGRAREC